MYKILIAEDDAIIARTLADHLRQWEYEVECVEDFKEVLGHYVRFDPQLVLMDVSLPFRNGFHWCEKIRALSKVPVIFISSVSDNMSIVMAVSMGGDDFIAKPFDLAVVTAKIKALLRRTYAFSGQLHVLERGGAILHLDDAAVEYQGQKTELTKNEFKILRILMENPGRILSRETIMERLWESDSFIDDNTLTVNMARLRKKLEGVGLSDFIVTKKGMGYLVE